MSTVTDAAEGARKFADAVTEATVASIKHNQEIANKAFQTWTGAVISALGSTSVSDLADAVTGTVSSGFELAKEAVEGQRQLAEKLLAAAYPGSK